MTRRRDLCRLAGFAPAAFLAGAPAKLPNATLSEKQAKLTREPFGDLRIYFEGPTDQLKSVTTGSLRLKAGMSPHPPHVHDDEEEFIIVAEGTGEISIDGKVTPVGPGAIMYCAARRTHGIVNTGKTPMLFYFYKWRA